MTCAHVGHTYGAKMQCGGVEGGNAGKRTVCRLMHNSRFESIDTSSLSIAHEYETNATPVTYGVFPRSKRFFLTICLVSLNAEKMTQEKMSGERKTIEISHEYLSCSMEKSSANIEVSNHMIRENFRGMLCSRRTKFSHELFLSFMCNFLLEKLSNAHRSVFLTLDVSCLQQLIVAGEMYHVN